jgi:hypothetical protein
MISSQEQQAVITLFEKGITKKRIARLVDIDVKTVRKIVSHNGDYDRRVRKDKIEVDEQLLRTLYADCEGYTQRVHEKLIEEHSFKLSYATVRRLLNQYGIGVSEPARAQRVPDIPGEEMQHDTSEHWLIIGTTKTKLICSGLYLRYCKMRYIKYYRRFNRFTMKCFMDEALRFFNYSARVCIIDNTSLAIDYGSGPRAVFSNEMVVFARNYGFEWYAHEINHSNRKAGKERNFRTVETSFIPGRKFSSLPDVNKQAFEWATQRYANRPQSKTGLIPSQLFEQEKASLLRLPEFVHPPCRNHQRIIDQYGYIAFNSNYYWVPPTSVKKLTVVEYANTISVFDTTHHCLIEHCLYDELTKNQVTESEDKKTPLHRKKQPNNIKRQCHNEEQALRKIGGSVTEYVDFVKLNQSGISQRSRYIRHLYALMKKTTAQLFIKAIQRALTYKVNNIHQLYNIFSQILKQPLYEKPSSFNVGEYEKRPEYIDGRFTQENQLELPL